MIHKYTSVWLLSNDCLRLVFSHEEHLVLGCVFEFLLQPPDESVAYIDEGEIVDEEKQRCHTHHHHHDHLIHSEQNPPVRIRPGVSIKVFINYWVLLSTDYE